jgi:hypothetical protein
MIYFIIYFIVFGFWYFVNFYSDDVSAIESLQSNESVEDSVVDSEKQQSEAVKS